MKRTVRGAEPELETDRPGPPNRSSIPIGRDRRGGSPGAARPARGPHPDSASPRPDAIAVAPLLFQLHALSACLLFAARPFTRLVPVWSAPVGYPVRPYPVCRRRGSAPPSPARRPGSRF
ncbi:respiratory nitrate reductase subunit gamma [Streptomyces olivaceus]